MTYGERVKRDILHMALTLWRIDPAYVTCRRVANELQIAHSNVYYHFGCNRLLRDATAYYAVRNGESRVIAQLIAINHKCIAHMSATERAEHMRLAASVVG